MEESLENNSGFLIPWAGRISKNAIPSVASLSQSTGVSAKYNWRRQGFSLSSLKIMDFVVFWSASFFFVFELVSHCHYNNKETNKQNKTSEHLVAYKNRQCFLIHLWMLCLPCLWSFWDLLPPEAIHRVMTGTRVWICCTNAFSAVLAHSKRPNQVTQPNPKSRAEVHFTYQNSIVKAWIV